MYKKSLFWLSRRQVRHVFPSESKTYSQILQPTIHRCRHFSNTVDAGETQVTKTKGQDVERLKDSTKPMKNIPFIKELFLGRFDKVRKCDDRLCCTEVRNTSGVVPHYLPDPMLCSDDKSHYRQFEDVLGTDTNESHMPSRSNETVAKVAEQQQEMLIFPELPKEDYDHLNELVAPIERFFDEAVDSKQIDIDGKIPDEILKHLGELGLFGMQIPEEYGGLQLDATHFARLAEITALDGSIAVTLAGHGSIGLKGILITGTDAQKEKYLPTLATGEHIAAFCLTEPTSGSDAASIQTRATLSEDGKTFYLNGGKIWITNGGIADVFTVFAKTEITNDKGEKQDKVTAFIVERAFGGVTSGKPEDKLGIRGSNTCEVHFDNTPIPIENVLGEVGGGFKVAMNILNSGRFSMGSSGAGILKRLIGYTAEHAISRTQFKEKLMNFELIKKKFAQMAVTTYAMESMAYLTALTLDSYQEPDASVEAAIVKIFSSEGCWNCASECLQVLGGLGYMKTYPYERYLRDARILMIFEGTNEILRLYTSLTGMQYAGKELKEFQRKARNPLNNPSIVWKGVKMFLKGTIGLQTKVKMNLRLSEEVHPSLKTQADQLEDSVLRFELAVQNLLVTHGGKIKDQQLQLERCANITMDIYAMTACIGRSSRSLSLGLRNAEHEKMLTRLFCEEATKRIRMNLHEIHEGPQVNSDDVRCRIADTIFENKGYAATHPLAHN